MIDAVDTYYDWVKGRIVLGTGLPAPINANRVFGGMVTAESWPPPNPKPEAFYLVQLQKFPTNRTQKNFGNQEYRFVLQWTWLIQGTDLSNTQAGGDRANRMRLDDAMGEELRAANFPQSCPLITLSQDADGNIVRTPYNPVSICRWTALTFGPRPSVRDDSGVLYGAAAVDVYALQRSLSQ